MVLQLDFDVGKRDDGKVHVHAAVAQFDHLGGESRVCRFHIAVAGFVYQAEKVGFRQQEIIHGSVNFSGLGEDVAVGRIAYLHGFSRPALHGNKPVEIVVAEGFLRVVGSLA